MRITITQLDLDSSGISPSDNPISNAIGRLYPKPDGGFRYSFVARNVVVVDHPTEIFGEAEIYELPADCQSFLAEWYLWPKSLDKPITFHLLNIKESNDHGN